MTRGVTSTTTPIKRKLIQNKNVAQLVSKFDPVHITAFSPRESESIESSPAKRQKLRSGVKHPSSQPPEI